MSRLESLVLFICRACSNRVDYLIRRRAYLFFMMGVPDEMVGKSWPLQNLKGAIFLNNGSILAI